jgi:predicted PurR-regulated permease PerM
VIRDLQGFSGEMPTRLPALLLKLHQIPFADRINTADIISRMQDAAAQGAGYVLESARNWVGVLGRIVVCLVLTLYFLLEGDQAYRWTLAFFPVDRRRRLDAALQRAAVRMGNWLLGQASLMLVLGLTSTIVFLSLHLRYAYALGFLTGLLNIVPVLGMLVVMKAQATPEEIQAVCDHIEQLGFRAHPLPGAQRTAIGITGNQGEVDRGNLESSPASPKSSASRRPTSWPAAT